MDDLKKWADSPLWDNEGCKNHYAYPILLSNAKAKVEGIRLSYGVPHDELYQHGVFLCAKSPQSHIGPFRWAIDFLVPDGTPVLAAFDGRVVEIQEGSSLWGDRPEYRDYLNYLTIAHENGEFSQYCHLGSGSVSGCGLNVGDIVSRGQQIAVVGKSGWTDRDHLHFIVFRGAKNESPFTFKSLKVKFSF